MDFPPSSPWSCRSKGDGSTSFYLEEKESPKAKRWSETVDGEVGQEFHLRWRKRIPSIECLPS